MIGERPICFDCKHFDEYSTEPFKCKAFPKGIPDAILMSEHNHTKPFKGDHGIQFEPIKGEK